MAEFLSPGVNPPGISGAGNPLFFDHAVLVVADLASSTRQFREMGFTVTPGGVHAGQLTHNALIAFEDGAYLELLAPYRWRSFLVLRLYHWIGLKRRHPSAGTPLGRRFAESLLMGPGINDYALGCGNLDQVIRSIRLRGLGLDGPGPGSRTRPDGQLVSWRTACPASRDLPFLIDDLTSRELRVPGVQAAMHANQARRVAAITIAVADLAASAARYQAMLGYQPLTESQAAFPPAEAPVNRFQIQSTIITLEQRIEPGNRPGIGGGKPVCIWLGFSDETTGKLESHHPAGQDFSLSK